MFKRLYIKERTFARVSFSKIYIPPGGLDSKGKGGSVEIVLFEWIRAYRVDGPVPPQKAGGRGVGCG